MTGSSTWPRVAAVVAFLLAGLILLGAAGGQITSAPTALIPLMAGIGILRGRVWSAYGLAVVQAAQLLLVPLLFLRVGSEIAGNRQAIPLVVVLILLTALFLAAGNSLKHGGGQRGLAWPWIAVAAVGTVPFLFVQAFVIPTSSMEDTLLLGDRILVQSFPKAKPERGDVVAFIFPMDRHQILIKRIVGSPGDRIRSLAGAVYRNSSALNEPYVVHKFPPDSYRDNFPAGRAQFSPYPAALEILQRSVVNGEVIVPEGKYFVLGDNRDNSLDSRYWGFLDGADIIGKPFLIYGSEEPLTPETLPTKRRGLQRVRWNRLFKVL